MSCRIAVAAFVLALSISARGDEAEQLRAVPFVFIGGAGDCGAAPGSNIVTSAWLPGMGLPDNGQPNTQVADTITGASAASRRDPHSGLLLNKNGPTADCSAAGASIRGVEGMKVGVTFELGFDYRNGGHCSGGAPRFNVSYHLGTVSGFSFVGGCASGVETPAPQDPLQWTRTRFTSIAPAFPPIPPGSTIDSIELIFDEGTDAPSPQDPNGVGLAVVDNIFVRNCPAATVTCPGTFIGSGRGIAPQPGENNGD